MMLIFIKTLNAMNATRSDDTVTADENTRNTERAEDTGDTAAQTASLDDLKFAADPDFDGTVDTTEANRVDDCVEPG